MPQETDPLEQTGIGVLPSKANIEKGISCNLPVDSAHRTANIKWLRYNWCPLRKWTSSVQLGGNPDDSINWEGLNCNRNQYWSTAESLWTWQLWHCMLLVFHHVWMSAGTKGTTLLKSAQQSCVQAASCVYQVKATSVTRQFNHNHNIKIQSAQLRLKYICKCPLRSKVIALLLSLMMPNKNASRI